MNQHDSFPTIGQLHARLRAGETTREQWLRQAQARADDSAAAHVFTRRYDAAALASARAADALAAQGVALHPLAGLPVTIKDLYDVAGETTLAGFELELHATTCARPCVHQQAAVAMVMHGFSAGRRALRAAAACGVQPAYQDLHEGGGTGRIRVHLDQRLHLFIGRVQPCEFKQRLDTGLVQQRHRVEQTLWQAGDHALLRQPGIAAPEAGTQPFAVAGKGVGKGKGFQGTVKRHNFSRGPVTHGSHNTRAPGSIGASATPSRVFKGIRGPGRMGGKRVTQRGLEVVRIDADDNLLMVRGSVPGSVGQIVEVRTDG